MNNNINKSFRLIDYINKSDDYIQNSIYASILVNYESLINNLDLLKHITDIKPIKYIICTCYKSAIIIEKELIHSSIPTILLDDFKNKDRSYIDIPSFQRHHLFIPLSYAMWNPKTNNNTNAWNICYKRYTNVHGDNLTTILSQETLSKIQSIINHFKMPKIEILKCYLISNYFQSNVKYTSQPNYNSIESILYDHLGTDTSIANATTLLLNNPTLNVNVRSIYDNGHTWNIVTIDDEIYYLDNTLSVINNTAHKFSDQYLLFGQDTAHHLGYYPENYIQNVIETDDYDYYQKKRSSKKIKKYLKNK